MDKTAFYEVMKNYFIADEYEVNLCSDEECNCCGSRRVFIIRKLEDYIWDEVYYDSREDYWDFLHINIPIGFDNSEEFKDFLKDYVIKEEHKHWIIDDINRDR